MNPLSLLRRSYVLVILALLLAADIAGVVHAFRGHGRRDGIIAIALPPYGIYRAGEGILHRSPLSDEQILEMAQTGEGRRSLAEGMMLKTDVWEALLALIAQRKNSAFSTTMQEGGIVYDITATVPPEGPVTLLIRAAGAADLVLTLSDENRDQEPDTLKTVKQVNGKPEEHNTPLAKYGTDDASQFFLAWSLAWGTIAEELRSTPVTVSQ